MISLGIFLKCLEDKSEEVCDADGVYVELQNQKLGGGGEIRELMGSLLTISCIPA